MTAIDRIRRVIAGESIAEKTERVEKGFDIVVGIDMKRRESIIYIEV